MPHSPGNNQLDVVVIGGGVVGVCAAYELATRGLKVAVIEQGPHVGAGASSGNAGLIVPSHIVPLASPGVIAQGLRWMLQPDSPFYIKPRPSLSLLRWLWQFRKACTAAHVERASPLLRDLHRESLALYQRLSDSLGLDVGFERRGLLDLFISEKGMDHGREEAAILSAAGVAAEVLSARQVREREPAAGSHVIGGVYFPEDAHIIPNRFVEALAHKTTDIGLVFHTNTKVIAFERQGRRLHAARTSNGRFAADQFVLATGAWSQSLAKSLRLRVLIEPAKGYGVNLKRSGGMPSMPLRLGEAKVAVTPMGETLRLAGTLELAGMDTSINERRVSAIRRAAAQYLDLKEPLEEQSVWRGLRPCTPDGLPLLGRPGKYDNLVIAAGHAMIGQSLGPVTGRLVADIVTDQPLGLDLSLLNPDRFS